MKCIFLWVFTIIDVSMEGVWVGKKVGAKLVQCDVAGDSEARVKVWI